MTRPTLKNLAFAGLISAINLFSACNHDAEIISGIDPNPTDTSSNSTSQCSPDTMYFMQQVLPLLSSGCAMSGCHDAGSHKEGVVLDSYSAIMSTGGINISQPTQSKIYRQMLKSDEDRMPPPPAAAFTSSQLAIISKWISQGAKDNSCLESGCDTTNVTYSNQIKSLVSNNCQGCHSGNSPGGGINLVQYSDIKAIADNGTFIGTIDHLPGYSAMPKNGNKLTDCQINMVKIWISHGALNN